MLIILTIFFPDQSLAQSSSPWRLGADIQFQETVFAEPFGTDTNDSLFHFEITPMVTWRKDARWQFYAHPVFMTNPNNNSEMERFFFDPQEVYFKFQKNEVIIQAGYNIITWGVMDIYNPVDIINTKQLFDPLKGVKMGALSLSISESLPFFDYDFIYIPQSRVALLPQVNSRWLPRKIFVPQVPNNDLVLLLPDHLNYRYGNSSNLNYCLENNLGLRLQKNISVFDLSLSSYEGVANMPLIEPQVTGTITQVSPKTVIQVDPNITLNTKNYRIQEVGFSIVAHPWDLLIKYETSYTQSLGEDPNLPGWVHENVWGLEKTFNFSEGSLTGILQNSFLQTQKRNDSNISFLEIFRNAWMLGGRLTWREVWSASLVSLYDHVHRSHFEEMTLGKRIFDTWTLHLTAQFIAGPSDSPLGVYDKNHSVSAGLSRSF